jgi:hypothetical protein
MSDQEQSAERLLGATLDLPPERRSAYLDQACRGAPELRRLVEELLLRNGFLDVPPSPADGGSSSTAKTSATNGDLAAGTARALLDYRASRRRGNGFRVSGAR